MCYDYVDEIVEPFTASCYCITVHYRYLPGTRFHDGTLQWQQG